MVVQPLILYIVAAGQEFNRIAWNCLKKTDGQYTIGNIGKTKNHMLNL